MPAFELVGERYPRLDPVTGYNLKARIYDASYKASSDAYSFLRELRIYLGR